MSKGIREFAVEAFNAKLPQRAELGNTKFRKEVMGEIMEKFGVSNFSAAGAYNTALKLARETNPEAVQGLGRPEGWTGGNTKANKEKKAAAKITEATASTEVANAVIGAAVAAEPSAVYKTARKFVDGKPV